MTEDEAMTKWCFAAVASHTNPRGGFETPEQLGDMPAYPKTFPCIGSACMAWRWRCMPRGARRQPASEAFAAYDIPAEVGDGYCGLSGAPQ